ncbi:MAG TPA: hypothetical protein VIK72_15110 [Clostridiaceae bacterium]
MLEEAYIKEYIAKGCRLFFFIEYIPFDASSVGLVIKDSQRLEFMDIKKSSLNQVLNSSLLIRIRNFNQSKEGHTSKGGCSLFENKDILETYIKDQGEIKL